MKRRLGSIVLAVVLASVGTFVLLAYVRSAEERALAGEQVVEVYVVSEPIDRGTSDDELAGRVKLAKIPSKVQAADSVRELEALDGRVAAVDLVPGEQLLATRFVTPEDLVAQGQIEVPDGLMQVTVSLDPERALGGRVKPGDTVGVLASFDPFTGVDPPGDEPAPQTPNSTHLILHKVLVTQVEGGAAQPSAGIPGQEAPPQPTSPQGKLLVTLAVEAPSVERVVFTAEHGFIWLSHEPPATPEDGTTIQTRDTIYR